MLERDLEAAREVLGPQDEDSKLFYWNWDRKHYTSEHIYNDGFHPNYHANDPYYETLRPHRREPSPPEETLQQRRRL